MKDPTAAYNIIKDLTPFVDTIEKQAGKQKENKIIWATILNDLWSCNSYLDSYYYSSGSNRTVAMLVYLTE